MSDKNILIGISGIKEEPTVFVEPTISKKRFEKQKKKMIELINKAEGVFMIVSVPTDEKDLHTRLLVPDDDEKLAKKLMSKAMEHIKLIRIKMGKQQ